MGDVIMILNSDSMIESSEPKAVEEITKAIDILRTTILFTPESDDDDSLNFDISPMVSAKTIQLLGLLEQAEGISLELDIAYKAASND
jgi:hypothetical protein